MKKIQMLLANTDRHTNNQIEAAVLDACYEQLAVECVRTARVDELVSCGCHAAIGLVVLVPDALIAEPSRHSIRVELAEVATALRAIKRRTSTPVIAVNVRPQDQADLLEAGADAVLGIPFHGEAFKAEVRQALRLAESVETPTRSRWSFASIFTF